MKISRNFHRDDNNHKEDVYKKIILDIGQSNLERLECNAPAEKKKVLNIS